MRMPNRDWDGEFPNIGSVIADKYCIDRVLGSGGMGKVFSATHLMTGRRFALKWMSAATSQGEEARERFIREFQTAGSIVHSNVGAVLDVGTQHGSLYIVMEYLEGESLGSRLARGPMPATECVPIIVEAMRGVAAAHRQDVIHRDLKPENIFICLNPGRERPEIKVLDFGVMKAVNARAHQLPTITARGMTVGTPPYMAPEQVLGESTVDHRADVYALGVILYESLSGRLPFWGRSGMRLLERIVQGSPPPLSTVARSLPDGLEAIVMRALERDPNERYASIEEFAMQLKPWAADVEFWPSTVIATQLLDSGTHGLPAAYPASGPRVREKTPRTSTGALKSDATATSVTAPIRSPGRGSMWGAQTERVPQLSQTRPTRSHLWAWLVLAGFVASATLWVLQRSGARPVGTKPASAIVLPTTPGAGPASAAPPRPLDPPAQTEIAEPLEGRLPDAAPATLITPTDTSREAAVQAKPDPLPELADLEEPIERASPPRRAAARPRHKDQAKTPREPTAERESAAETREPEAAAPPVAEEAPAPKAIHKTSGVSLSDF